MPLRGDPLFHQWQAAIRESVLLPRLSAGHGNRSHDNYRCFALRAERSRETRDLHLQG
jgi:hypothetical protein